MEKNIENVTAVFETFNMADKIEELKLLVEKKQLRVFDGAHIVIAVPSFDESERSIYKHDKALFDAQRHDAYELVRFILEETRSCVTGLILDANKTIDVAKMQVDYIIFLHEFMRFEREYILGILAEYGSGMPYVIELY